MKRKVISLASILFIFLYSAFSIAQEGNLSMSQYQLGSGDRVKISVFGQDDLSMEVRLPDVGTINYPFLGEIKLVGLTADEVEKKSALGALDYMGLSAGTKMTDVDIDRVFIGSCTNARIEDLRAAAAVARGHCVASDVHAMVVPGSGQVTCPLGRRCRPTQNLAWCTYPRIHRRSISSEGSVKVMACSVRVSSRSMWRPAIGPGTSRPCITTSGTSITPRPRFHSM